MVFSASPAASNGSSPRVRGKLDFSFRALPHPRLIPACAGKTQTSSAATCQTRAHPRVCGENQDSSILDLTGAGSSPRVRGKRRQLFIKRRLEGLIPACAGKTRTKRHKVFGGAAHPRVCGENVTTWPPVKAQSGSSPRVRGKRGFHSPAILSSGLIPACAGKTSTVIHLDQQERAHPRVCGENEASDFPASGIPGSSPRVRGKPHRRDHGPVRGRLIPACAGKTS